MVNNNFSILKVCIAFVSVSAFAQLAQLKELDEAQSNPMFLSEFLSDDPDTTKKLIYPLGTKKPGDGKSHSLDLEDPSNVKKVTEYDTASGKFITRRTIGDSTILDEPDYESVDEYLKSSNTDFVHNYFKDRAKAQNFTSDSKSPLKFKIGPKAFEDIFGSEFVDIKPQGSAELIFMGEMNRVLNPAWNIKAQRNNQFKFDQKIKINVLGKIGEKINLNFNYDTEATMDFDNQMKLNFQGKEDDILKSIELGQISFPVQSSLISGSTNLFGLKNKLQFGKFSITTVLAKQNTDRKEITVEGGAQKTQFNIAADQYDANRHFFLSQYFMNEYDNWASNTPLIMTPLNITRIEVWVTNVSGKPQETRNIVAWQDLGEHGKHPDGTPNMFYDNGIVYLEKNVAYEGPDNEANTLYNVLSKNEGLRNISTVVTELEKIKAQDRTIADQQDFTMINNARLLSTTEYKVNQNFGYISLNQPLNSDEVLAVSYEYTLNGSRHQVGEFSRDFQPDPTNPSLLFLKMLKSQQVRTDLPMWNLMMKNIYSLNQGRIEQEDFRLEVIYADDESGADLPYIPEASEKLLNGTQLLKVLGLDKVNKQSQAMPDGVYDFVIGLTVDVDNGKVIFPQRQPFGNYLRSKFSNQDLADDYVYQALYDSIQAVAVQQAYYNKFFLRGFFKGTSGSEISLNAYNVQPGSVKVSVGGVQLQENVDFVVDYSLGRVRITNDSYLNSGQQIKVSHESTNFLLQAKALYGSRMEYKFSEDFGIGGTFMFLRERPFTQKVTVGSEPVKNGIFGLDLQYRRDSRFITKLVDQLPFLETKEMSEISFQGEVAKLITGHPKVLNNDTTKEGTSYIDDFEGSEVPFALTTSVFNWYLSSTPQGQNGLFPYATSTANDLSNGWGRAKLAWYVLDPLFYGLNSANLTPSHIKKDVKQLSNHYVRQVTQREIFPQRQLSTGTPPTQTTFDLAYFPDQRGPYNYDYQHVDNNGRLTNPEGNWAGISTRIQNNNFEANNVQYIEFWLMDPFIYDDQSKGGEFYINLGQVSEDVLSDGRKSYENGLPEDASNDNTLFTNWGRIPVIPNINNTFTNEPSARKFQDVGLDGLASEAERSFYDSVFLEGMRQKFGESSPVYKRALADPSSDDYHYFLGNDYDQSEVSIINRYKAYNNMEGNTPIPEANSSISNQASSYPDDEDINRDFTLNTTEAYFQYKVELKPSKMSVGDNFITDIREAPVQLANGKEEVVKWYQFKVPIQSYEKRIGNIVDFKTIRFMRLLLRGFQDSVVCRFAQFQLIRGSWRNYALNLGQPGETVTTDPSSGTLFDISAVNLEENSKRSPVRYVLPPGITRQVNYSTLNQVQQNEQSLSLKVCNLEDGDARAVFKNTTFDVRMFKKLRMFVHAEGPDLKDDDLTLFIRLGSDLNGHYYEYEYPLKVTPYGSTKAEIIWPEENEIELLLEEFYKVKIARDSSQQAVTQAYSRKRSSGRGIVSVLGNPDLSNVKIIMIGVRNPKKSNNVFSDTDDGLPKCAEVWVNELRLTDFNQQGGWASTARLTAKLADFGQLNLVGATRSIGFGSIEQSLLERSQEDMKSYNIQSQFALDKFFPEKAGLKLPLYLDYGQTFIRPKYNPVQPDVLLETTLAAAGEGQKSEILAKAQSVETRRSLNLVNVTKKRTKPGAVLYPWSVENFTGTYKFTEVVKHDIFTVFDSTRTHTGILVYTYNIKQKPFKPFKKIKKKSLKLISDFNINYLPTSFSFQGQVNRKYNTILFRNNDNIESIVLPNYDKTFNFMRNYNFRYNLTSSLKFNYIGNAESIIDEPPGPIATEKKKDSVWANFKNFGRQNGYNHTLNLNYTVPIDKLPMMDFVSLSTDYKGGYKWEAAKPAADSLGNVISNSAAFTVNNQLNFLTLYNKSQFLRTINSGKSNIDRIRKEREKKQKIKEQEEAKKNGAITTPKSKTEEESGDEEEEDLVNESFIKIVEGSMRVLMMVRNFNINYALTDGTILPGFLPKPDWIGNDPLATGAPGWDFIAGSQKDIRLKAANNGWITAQPGLQSFYATTHSNNITGNTLIEPVKNFRINVDFSRRYAINLQENFRNVGTIDSIDFQSLGTYESGNFSMSMISLKTAFNKPVRDKDGKILYDPLVEQFEDNRYIISNRIAAERGITAIDDTTGYHKGLYESSQDVLIPSFIAAYTGQDAKDVKMNLFPMIPLPNWRLSYNGLSQLKMFKKKFRSITLSHGYKSTYSISNFISALDYNKDQQIAPEDKPSGDNYIPKYQIQQISMAEQFSPLLGIDVTWKSNWTTKLEYVKSRTVVFNFTNFQIQEQSQRSITVGLGYRTKGLVIPFVKKEGKKWVLENDFTFKCDFQFRENRQILWILDPDVDHTKSSSDVEKNINTPVAGDKMINVNPTIDYLINKNLTLRIFFTRLINTPLISNSYPRKNATFGFSLRYTLT